VGFVRERKAEKCLAILFCDLQENIVIIHIIQQIFFLVSLIQRQSFLGIKTTE
jgi:hypothetical protein